jgi:hypothetical protein
MITPHQINNLHAAIKEHISDEIEIVAIPGMIRNSGKNLDVVRVTIGHRSRKRAYDFIYRGLSTEFSRWLKKKVDEIKNK